MSDYGLVLCCDKHLWQKTVQGSCAEGLCKPKLWNSVSSHDLSQDLHEKDCSQYSL